MNYRKRERETQITKYIRLHVGTEQCLGVHVSMWERKRNSKEICETIEKHAESQCD